MQTDKSTSESGKSVNRFKKGVSTLLDKTIYIQTQEGAQAQLADYKSENAPKIDARALEDAKLQLLMQLMHLLYRKITIL